MAGQPSKTVSEAFAMAKTHVTLAGGRPRFLLMKKRPGRTDPRFSGRPELHARFQNSRGKLMSKDEHYDVLLWVEGAKDFATSVTYEICDDSFDEQFWEISRKEDTRFAT